MTIHQETLERLLIDRAMNALPPDCSELLGDWLEQNPVSSSVRKEIDDTIALARTVLHEDETVKLPAFPERKLIESAKHARRWRVAAKVTSLAAAIVLGFLLHASWSSKAPQPRQTVTPVFVDSSKSSETNSRNKSTGIWSARFIYNRATTSQDEGGPRLKWNSPARLPQQEGNT